MLTNEDITIGILAGGRATRMNSQDKGLMLVHGIPIIKKIINKIENNSNNIVINANRNISKYESFNSQVIQDSLSDFQGPLAGIYSMLKNIRTNYLFTVPCDCPNFDWNVVKKFIDNFEETKDIHVAHNSLRSQPVFMLISKSMIDPLHDYLMSGNRKIDIFYKKNNFKYVYFNEDTSYFDNINTIEQLDEYNSK